MSLVKMSVFMAALVFGQTACTSTSKSTQPLPEQTHPYFSSVEDAVIHASNRVNPQSIVEDREFIGLILFNPRAVDKNLTFTYTISKGEPGTGHASGRFLKRKYMKVVALWHTHGAEHWTRKYFSDVDTQIANSMGVPFYMADYKGTLKVYAPGGRTIPAIQARNIGLGSNSGYALGEVIKSKINGRAIKIAVRAIDAVERYVSR